MKILLLFFCIIALHASYAQSEDSLKNHRIDTLVDVGDYKLHFYIVKGKGTPILFEAGNGDDGSVWKPLLNDIYHSTGATLITYDRAGLGKSGIDTSSISFEHEIENVEKALGKLGYNKKMFLVAHSFGGYYASYFAYRNVKKVIGAVFIDVTTPCFFTDAWTTNFTNAIKPEDWKMIKQYKPGLYYVLAHLGTISAFMHDKYINSSIPLTLIAAENILPMVKENEKGQWSECLKTFGTMANHKFVIAKNADHKVWEKSPNLVESEIVALYSKMNSKWGAARHWI